MPDHEITKDDIKNVITTIKDCADVGMYMFSKMSKSGAVFVGLGLLVKNLIVATENAEDTPVMRELKELKKELKKLGENMGNHFNDLKAFSVAQMFYKEIVVKTSVLTRAMNDTTAPRNEKAKDASNRFFKEMYDKHSPLEIGYALMEMLDNEVLNPLKMAMKADQLMTRNTFDGWRNLIASVLTQLWVLECFASGMFHEKDPHRQNQLASDQELFIKSANEWEKMYKTKRLFWPNNIRQFVENIQDKNAEKTSEQKAELIVAGLNKILTDDIFYVAVFRTQYYYHHYPKLPNQQIASKDRGGCHVFVYRSQEARHIKREYVDRMKTDVEAQRHQTGILQGLVAWITWPYVKDWGDRLFRNCGFVLVVREGEYVAIRSTHTEIFEWGPGWWLRGSFSKFLGPREMFVLLSGFK